MKCLSFNPASAAINGAQSIRLTETVSGTSWEHSSSFIIYQRLSGVLQPCIRLNCANKKTKTSTITRDKNVLKAAENHHLGLIALKHKSLLLHFFFCTTLIGVQSRSQRRWSIDCTKSGVLGMLQCHRERHNSCFKRGSGEVPPRSRGGIPNSNCRPDKAANRVWLLIHLSPGLLYSRPLRGLDWMWRGNIITLHFIFLTNKPSRTVTDGSPSHSAKQEQLYSLILSLRSMRLCYVMSNFAPTWPRPSLLC